MADSLPWATGRNSRDAPSSFEAKSIIAKMVREGLFEAVEAKIECVHFVTFSARGFRELLKFVPMMRSRGFNAVPDPSAKVVVVTFPWTETTTNPRKIDVTTAITTSSIRSTTVPVVESIVTFNKLSKLAPKIVQQTDTIESSSDELVIYPRPNACVAALRSDECDPFAISSIRVTLGEMAPVKFPAITFYDFAESRVCTSMVLPLFLTDLPVKIALVQSGQRVPWRVDVAIVKDENIGSMFYSPPKVLKFAAPVFSAVMICDRAFLAEPTMPAFDISQEVEMSTVIEWLRNIKAVHSLEPEPVMMLDIFRSQVKMPLSEVIDRMSAFLPKTADNELIMEYLRAAVAPSGGKLRLTYGIT